jgi:hypothetical protein
MPQLLTPILLSATLLFSACATMPIESLPPTHPASEQAPEAKIHHTSTNLQGDATTLTTTQLLHESEQPQSDGMSNMPSMTH